MGGLPVKPKVQGYIADEVFVQFQNYCKLHKLSQSAGLEVVIAEFFGIKKEVTKQNENITSSTTYIETSNILASEVEKLNEKIILLECWRLDLEDISANISNANLSCLIANPATYLDGAVANLPANLVSDYADTLASSADNLTDLDADTSVNLASADADTAQVSEPESTLNSAAPSTSSEAIEQAPMKVTEVDVVPEAPAPSTPPRPSAAVTQRQLVTRFGVDKATIWRHHSDLPEWSKSKDPEGISWEYRSVKKGMPQYYPILG